MGSTYRGAHAVLRASAPLTDTYTECGRARPRREKEGAMIPAAFEYEAPTELAQAIDRLAKSGGEAKVLAGGQSLIPLMKFRLAQPARIIDLNRIAGLAYVREDGDLRIGALTREVDLEESAVIRDRYP